MLDEARSHAAVEEKAVRWLVDEGIVTWPKRPVHLWLRRVYGRPSRHATIPVRMFGS